MLIDAKNKQITFYYLQCFSFNFVLGEYGDCKNNTGANQVN